MVVPGGVEGEVAEDFAGGGVDDGDVVVLGEDLRRGRCVRGCGCRCGLLGRFWGGWCR